MGGATETGRPTLRGTLRGLERSRLMAVISTGMMYPGRSRSRSLALVLALALALAPACSLDTGDSSSATLSLEGDVKDDVKLVDPPMPLEDYHPDTSHVIQLSWRPRAFLFPNFLSDQECDYIVNYSRPRVNRSEVVGTDGKGAVDPIRTSSGSHFEKWANPVIKRIEERVAAWTHIPIEYQEPMQVLKYVDGQKYGSHYDFSEGQANLTGGQRYCTVLMYLSDVEHGGETVFPNSQKDRTFKDETWSDCGKQGVAVKPRKGDALLFFSMKPNGKFDATSLHSGCPVLKGEKWSATKWIHTRNYGPPYRDPDVCQDDHGQCEYWATLGECDKNPKFMKGYGRGQSELGFCRKSCKVCS